MVAAYQTPTDDSYGTRKLAHYNAWLLDPKREFTSVYPGFPEDKQKEASRKAYVEDFIARRDEKAVKKAAAKAAKPAAKPATKAKAPRKGTVPTKQSMATQIYRDLGGEKAVVIAAIQKQLVMSLAGATTYYYNAKKLA